MKRAIVTGATGFIGSWLVQELLNNDIEVTVIVRDRNRLLPEFLQNNSCHIIETSIENLSIQHFVPREYDYFIHLAWGGVAPEEKNNIELQLKNIAVSLKALEVANSIGCKKFLASGTVAEYVLCKDIMDVNARQTPNDIYGAAKVSAHYFLEVRARQLNQNFNWIVIPSTFGPRRTDNNIITYTIKTLKKGKKPLYGSLTQMWDFLYVGEVVRAIRFIAEKGIDGKTYGIGSGKYRPLKVYMEELRDLINPDLPLGIGERSQTSSGDTFSSCVNIYDLISDTGFYPSINFQDGIKRTIDYID